MALREPPYSGPHDSERERRDQALRVINEFLDLNITTLITRELSKSERELLAEDTLNRRFAMALSGLNEAIELLQQSSTEYASEQFIDDKSAKGFFFVLENQYYGAIELRFKWDIEDTVEGISQKREVVKAVILPTEEYLEMVLDHDGLDEQCVIAREPDLDSKSISDQVSEMTLHGGRTVREAIGPQALGRIATLDHDNSGGSEPIYRPASIVYAPLNDPKAPGIERAIEIIKNMLGRFLEHIEHTEPSVDTLAS